MSSRIKAFGVCLAAVCVLLVLMLAWLPTPSGTPTTVRVQKTSSVAADDN